MDSIPTIFFLFIFALFSAILAFHLIEHHRLKSYLRKKYGAEQVNKIAKFFFYQTSALSLTMISSLIVITFFYWQLNNTKQELLTIKNTDIADENISPAPPVNVAPLPAQNTNDIPPTPPVDNSIRSVFESGQNPTDSKSAIDNIKTRYEEILVTYFFLQKCGKTTDSDYRSIFFALQKEAANLQAPERLQYDILTAAKGSYDEVYAKNECTEANISPIYQQYNSYIQSLSEKH